MKKELTELKIRHIDFYELKKDKKTVFFLGGPLEDYGIHEKDKVVLIDAETEERRVRKIKKIRCCNTLRETVAKTRNSKLGLKWWEARDYRTINFCVSISTMDKYGIIGVELKRKLTFKRALARTFLIILLMVSFVFTRYLFIRHNDKKINEAITLFYEDKPRYIFADYDAEMILTVKGNRIIEVTCRNERCLEVNPDELVRDWKLTEGVRYLYEYIVKKKSGIMGITLRSTENIVMTEELDFVFQKHITKEEEKELLDSAVEKSKFLNLFREKVYYESLWKELKKDYQYGKVYTCDMKDDKLQCHLLEKAIKPFKKILVDFLEGRLHLDNKLRSFIWTRLTEIKHTLDKFNIPNTFDKYFEWPDYSSHIILDGEYYKYEIEYSYDDLYIENTFYYTERRDFRFDHELKKSYGIRKLIAFSIFDLDLLNPAKSLEDAEINISRIVSSDIIETKDWEEKVE